jgi:hypothetical protein
MSVELDVSAIVPSFGSTLRCRPLLRWLPWVGSPASQLLLRHSDFLLPLLAHASRFARWFRLSAEKTGAPKFLGDPRHTCPGQRPRWSLPEQASGASPLRLALSVLPSKPSDSSASTNPIFRGPIPQPAGSLSTLRVGRYLPLTQDSLSAGGLALAEREFNPLGRLPGFCMFWLHTHLQDEAYLAHEGARALRARGEGSAQSAEARAPAD